MTMDGKSPLSGALDGTFENFRQSLDRTRPSLKPYETGTVTYLGEGIARIDGLPGVRSEEIIRFPGGRIGMAFNLDTDEVGVTLMDHHQGLKAGDEVRRSDRVLDTPVGETLLGRVVNPLGVPLDDRGPILTTLRMPVEREAPAIMDRAPVSVPLQTGLKVVDALIPIGRGQRELILGDRQTGKTAIAVDTILNQRDTGMVCVYCAIGLRSAAIARVVNQLRDHDALDFTCVVATTEEDPPGLRFIAPFAAMSMAEHFRDNGRHALIVLDDLTRHARAYREISLLLRRPPGREAFPGDIFYLHSRLLERSTQLKDSLGGGSLTALPIIETEAQNISAYIPTNVISITDGQIYLSPDLFHKGILPAVDVGRSVSRVGGKAQAPAYRSVAGDLRITYSQFNELEAFARFGARLDDETRRTLDRGQRVREILKQKEARPMGPAAQLAILLAGVSGLLDPVALEAIPTIEASIVALLESEGGELVHQIEGGAPLSDLSREDMLKLASKAIAAWKETAG